MVTHSSILAWEILWTKESSGLQFSGRKRDRYDSVTKQQQIVSNYHYIIIIIR